MLAFFMKLLLGVGLIYLGKLFTSTIKNLTAQNDDDNKSTLFFVKLGRPVAVLVGGLMLLWAFAGTSVLWVKSGNIATLKRVYFGGQLPPGQIVALDGQLGPQARIWTAGFHFVPFITLLNEVEYSPVFTVPNGKCAILSAKDGIPPIGGAAFADPMPDATKARMVNDAAYFLTDGKGQRGPQTTVLTPGSYTINPYLWEPPQLIDAIRVEQGTVGVVKSSVRAAVDFGLFKRPIPEDGKLKILTGDKLPRGSVSALLVPVGLIGVWEEPLPNGLYYVNTAAYKITMVPTTAQVYEYKGGYKRRTVQLTLNDKGQITEQVAEVDVQPVPNSADTAISTQPEGWTVWQELRVIGQISPELAPFVVASLGLNESNASQIVEDRVVTPIIRSVVRDVEGGAQIPIRQQKAIVNKDGMPVLDEKGEPKTETANEFRSVKVLDLVENRTSLETAIEDRARPEALKEGVTIMEVRLSESAIPPELLLARKREQLAQQLSKAWKQEEIAQGQRQKTENARAQAEQQPELVKAEIAAQAAEQRKKGRMIEAEGEKGYLLALAEGQKAQSLVLGQDVTAKLQMFQLALKALQDIAEKNPTLIATGLEHAHKFVPTVQVTTTGGASAGLEGAAAVFGHMFSGSNGDIVPAKSTTASK